MDALDLPLKYLLLGWILRHIKCKEKAQEVSTISTEPWVSCRKLSFVVEGLLKAGTTKSKLGNWAYTKLLIYNTKLLNDIKLGDELRIVATGFIHKGRD